MRDRRYFVSLAASATAAALALAGIFLFVSLTGLAGAIGLAAVPAAFLCWFYMGPRPDLAPSPHPPPQQKPGGKRGLESGRGRAGGGDA